MTFGSGANDPFGRPTPFSISHIPDPFAPAPQQPFGAAPSQNDPFAAPPPRDSHRRSSRRIEPRDPFATGGNQHRQNDRPRDHHHHPRASSRPHNNTPRDPFAPPPHSQQPRDPFAPVDDRNNYNEQRNPRQSGQGHRRDSRRSLFMKDVPPDLFSRRAIEQHFNSSVATVIDISLRGQPNGTRRTAVISFRTDEEATFALKDCAYFHDTLLALSYFGYKPQPDPAAAISDKNHELVFTHVPPDLFSDDAIKNLFNSISNGGVVHVSVKERPFRSGIKRTAIIKLVDIPHATKALQNLPLYHGQKLQVSYRHRHAQSNDDQTQGRGDTGRNDQVNTQPNDPFGRDSNTQDISRAESEKADEEMMITDYRDSAAANQFARNSPNFGSNHPNEFPVNNSSQFPNNAARFPQNNTDAHPSNNRNRLPSNNPSQFPPANSNQFPSSAPNQFPSAYPDPFAPTGSPQFPSNNASPFPNNEAQFPANNATQLPSASTPPFPTGNQNQRRSNNSSQFKNPSHFAPKEQGQLGTNGANEFPSDNANQFQDNETYGNQQATNDVRRHIFDGQQNEKQLREKPEWDPVAYAERQKKISELKEKIKETERAIDARAKQRKSDAKAREAQQRINDAKAKAKLGMVKRQQEKWNPIGKSEPVASGKGKLRLKENSESGRNKIPTLSSDQRTSDIKGETVTNFGAMSGNAGIPRIGRNGDAGSNRSGGAREQGNPQAEGQHRSGNQARRADEYLDTQGHDADRKRGSENNWRGVGEKLDIQFAKTLVGTCQLMCPDKEFEERFEQDDVSRFEKTDGEFDRYKAVKKYRRSAAISEQPRPKDVRPINVLHRTLLYLRGICDTDAEFSAIHHFVRDRTRSLRQDLTLQGLNDDECIQIHEESVRFHILSEHRLFGEDPAKFVSKQNLEQLDKCLISLREFYQLRRDRGLPTPPNEPEMQAYYLMTQMSNLATCVQLLSGFKDTPDILHSAPVQFALRVMRSSSSLTGNAASFFRCVRNAPYLAACLMHSRFTEVRKRTMRVMNHVYGNVSAQDSFSISSLTDTLGFEDVDEAISFCETLGCDLTGLNGPASEVKILTPSKSFNEDNVSMWVQRKAENLIESKVKGERISDVIANNNFKDMRKPTRVRTTSFLTKRTVSTWTEAQTQNSVLTRLGGRAPPVAPVRSAQLAIDESPLLGDEDVSRQPNQSPANTAREASDVEQTTAGKPIAKSVEDESAVKSTTSPTPVVTPSAEKPPNNPESGEPPSGVQEKQWDIVSAVPHSIVPSFHTPAIPPPLFGYGKSILDNPKVPYEPPPLSNVHGPDAQPTFEAVGYPRSAEIVPPLVTGMVPPQAPSAVFGPPHLNNTAPVISNTDVNPPRPTNEAPRVSHPIETDTVLHADVVPPTRDVVLDTEQDDHLVRSDGTETMHENVTVMDEGILEDDKEPSVAMKHHTSVEECAGRLDAVSENVDRFLASNNPLRPTADFDAIFGEAEDLHNSLSDAAKGAEELLEEAARIDIENKWVGDDLSTPTKKALEPSIRRANGQWEHVRFWMMQTEYLRHSFEWKVTQTRSRLLLDSPLQFEKPDVFGEDVNPEFSSIIASTRQRQTACLRRVANGMLIKLLRKCQMAMLDESPSGSGAAFKWIQNMVCGKDITRTGVVRSVKVMDDKCDRYLSVLNVSKEHEVPHTSDLWFVAFDRNKENELDDFRSALSEKLREGAQARRGLNIAPPAVVVVEYYSYSAASKRVPTLTANDLGDVQNDCTGVYIHRIVDDPENVFVLSDTARKAMIRRESLKRRPRKVKQVSQLLREAGTRAWMNRVVLFDERYDDQNSVADTVIADVNKAWKEVASSLVRESERWPTEMSEPRIKLLTIAQKIQRDVVLPRRDATSSMSEYIERLMTYGKPVRKTSIVSGKREHEVVRFCRWLDDLLPVVIQKDIGATGEGTVDLMFEELDAKQCNDFREVQRRFLTMNRVGGPADGNGGSKRGRSGEEYEARASEKRARLSDKSRRALCQMMAARENEYARYLATLCTMEEEMRVTGRRSSHGAPRSGPRY